MIACHVRFREKYLFLLALSIILLFTFTTYTFTTDIGIKRANIEFERDDHVFINQRATLQITNEQDIEPKEVYNVTRIRDKIILSGDLPLISGGEDAQKISRQRRDKVKQMMLHSWNGYKNYSWGYNELSPLNKNGHLTSIFGQEKLGATIIDAMDTLFIMGLHEEFNEAKLWLEQCDFNSVSSYVSVFEVNIRFIGGLLTCYALTGDDLFRDKAKSIAEKLLPAFNTPTGIPYSLVNLSTGKLMNYYWASKGSSILSEYGSLYLEFAYLSEITGNPIFKNKVDDIMEFLDKKVKPNGLYPNYIDPKTGKWTGMHVSMGSLGDSFYEYLLKIWLQSNKKNDMPRRMFEEAIDAMLEQMLFISKEGLVHFSELKNGNPDHVMEHLACFSGGLLGLASVTLNNSKSEKYLKTGADLTHTCHESYDRSETKLGPERFRFRVGQEAKASNHGDKYYILRPEVVESYFYMYRLTKDEKYRDWGWEAVKAIEKHCKVASGGYSGIKNVYDSNPIKDDVQQSFFLAETLKYLYLLYSDEKLISLDKWVFNTEAHPLPIKNANPYFRVTTM
ncbi:unnamed protein product [Brassicogethes aeneus]|uniref:alpha-1,2-Mannosidase n=1 Tax=Brassicogethes aeneus TaxID=1431903 RepID=A0A9P0BDD4_BRAAE|nr:unnamed protein product [Brassicogethes aeneus]